MIKEEIEIPEAINVADNNESTKAFSVMDVVSDDSLNDNVKKKNEDSKDADNDSNDDFESEEEEPPESNNVLSDYISNDLINENMFNMTEIKNALLNALKIEFGKLLTMELSKDQAAALRDNIEELKNSKLFKLNEKFTLPDNPTLKDEFVVHMLSTEMKRLINKKLWKEHLMIDLAGKALNTIDCSLSIEKRVLNVKSK
jgi:small-conductance mechanosensitive channel